MMMRTYFILHFFFILLFFVSCGHEEKTEKKPPNIVIIIADDHTNQIISAYGSQIAKTPHIDQLYEEGGIFNRAYVGNSLCGQVGHLF